MKTEGEPNGEQWQKRKKNNLSACITDKKRMYAIYTNELKRFLKSLTYTWTHELNERKQLFSKDQHLLHRHLTYNFSTFVCYFLRPNSLYSNCVHSYGLILFSFFHLLLNMLPYEYFILCLLRFSCALTIKIMPKTERDRIRGETEIRITTRKNQPNVKCAIFYALYRSICNESLSETNKELQWSWIKKNLHG